MRIVLVTGGFDPLHSGHISYFKAAKTLGDMLIVGLNSDKWLARKKGQFFMPFNERIEIVRNLAVVNAVIEEFDDTDNSSKDAIIRVRQQYPTAEIVFANGGDRTAANIPEMDLLDNNLTFRFGVGGLSKLNSSSWILDNWKNPKTLRSWGWYRVLDDKLNYKVKELIIEPGKSLSMQRHFKRGEHWYVLKGSCIVETVFNNDTQIVQLDENFSYNIEKEVWHKAINNSGEECHILEIQYGDVCVEEDIERL